MHWKTLIVILLIILSGIYLNETGRWDELGELRGRFEESKIAGRMKEVQEDLGHKIKNISSNLTKEQEKRMDKTMKNYRVDFISAFGECNNHEIQKLKILCMLSPVGEEINIDNLSIEIRGRKMDYSIVPIRDQDSSITHKSRIGYQDLFYLIIETTSLNFGGDSIIEFETEIDGSRNSYALRSPSYLTGVVELEPIVKNK